MITKTVKATVKVHVRVLDSWLILHIKGPTGRLTKKYHFHLICSLLVPDYTVSKIVETKVG